MDLGMNYWQVAAGESVTKRDYCDVFLKFGVMLLDSAERGSVDDNRKWYEGNMISSNSRH